MGASNGDRARQSRESTLSLLLGIPAFFVILAVLILVHEVGHFSMAKLMRVRVDEFGLGFPPRLKTWRRGDTMYSLNTIPLGGFVRMRGENGEDGPPDAFGSKPPWQRLLILAAGPAANLAVAVTILFLVFVGGTPKSLAIVTAVARHSPAQLAGLRNGDQVVSLDSTHIRYLSDLQAASDRHAGHLVRLEIKRGSKILTLHLVPRKHPPVNQGRIGVSMERSTTVRYGPRAAAGMAFDEMSLMASAVPTLAHDLARHDGSQVAGPIGIANATTQVVNQEPQNGIGSLFFFVALLSANLGILNLLPIPALDGGRIVFVLISWVRKRNVDPEVEGAVHMIGMAVLLMVILVVSYHDVIRWIGGGSF